MGKIYTFISKDQVNKKVKTSDLQTWLDNGWSIGNWNQEELNARSGAGVKKKLDQMREDGVYDDYISSISKKVSSGLKSFWDNVADDDFKLNRELKRAETRANWTDDEKQEYHDKMSNSAKLDRASISKEEYRRRKKKEIETKKKNGTVNSSSPENESYKILLSIYPDTLRWYNKDSRYPFECDFYIPSEDLFIECNYHYTHGPHPFDITNDDDIKLLEIIRSKQDYLEDGSKNSYFIYEDVWTRRDVEKIKCASDNNLNYAVFYSFDEFKERFEVKYETY